MIFATFSDDVAPLIEWLGDEMVENIDRVVGRGMVLLGTYSQYMPNNWKLYMENARFLPCEHFAHVPSDVPDKSSLHERWNVKLSDNGWHHISYSIAETDEEDQYDAKKLRAVKDGYTADPTLVKGWFEWNNFGYTIDIPKFRRAADFTSFCRLCLPKGPEECELLWWCLAHQRIPMSNKKFGSSSPI